MPFSFIQANAVTLTTGVNVQTFDLEPAINGRIANFADQYGLYRFTRLRCRLYNPGPAGASAAESVVQCLAYTNEPIDTAPATAAAAANMEASIVTGFHNQVGSESAPTQFTTQVQTLELTSKLLCRDNANQWWKTIASANVEEFSEVQGQLFLVTDSNAASSSVVGFCIHFKGIIEFSCPLNSAQTPMDRARGSPVVQIPAVVHRSRVAPA